jgi:hypothetical protein
MKANSLVQESVVPFWREARAQAIDFRHDDLRQDIGISAVHGLITFSRGAIGGFLRLAPPASYCEAGLHPIVRNSESLQLSNPIWFAITVTDPDNNKWSQT